MGNWMQFEKCAGCGWDIGTGEGERSCSWGECAYLPDDLDVYLRAVPVQLLQPRGQSNL